jgi:signal transduction histidine kinase
VEGVVRFRHQLIVGTGLLVVVAACISAVAVLTLYLSNSRAVDVTQHVLDDLAAVQSVRVRAERVVSAGRGYLLSGNDNSRRKLTDYEKQLDVALERLRALRAEDIHANLRRIEQRLLEYSRATVAVARQRSAQDDVDALARAFELEVVPKRLALDEAVDSLVATERARIMVETKRASEVSRRLVTAVLAACCLGIAISIALAWIVIRKLDGQYKREQLAKRDAARAAFARKQLLDIVAHDLLSPLNAIVLGIEVMETDGHRLPHAAPIKRSAERMQRLVNDLLDVSRAETLGLDLTRDEHHAAQLLEAMQEQFQELARRNGVKLRVEAGSDVRAFVDRDRVLQVLANLVGNALKYARRGDEIVLGVRELQDGRARFFVRDAGPGIPREEVDQLFEAYRQGSGRARRGSLGLGLYICKTLVEAHGGRIGADSAVGAGTSFWFDIPRAAQDPPARGAA